MVKIEVKDGKPLEAMSDFFRRLLSEKVVGGVLVPQEIPSGETVALTLVAPACPDWSWKASCGRRTRRSRSSTASRSPKVPTSKVPPSSPSSATASGFRSTALISICGAGESVPGHSGRDSRPSGCEKGFLHQRPPPLAPRSSFHTQARRERRKPRS